LPISFVVEPGAALDSLVRDDAIVTVLQKWKRQPVKKNVLGGLLYNGGGNFILIPMNFDK
jgi:hypothetical protein